MRNVKIWEYEGDYYIQGEGEFPLCMNTKEAAAELSALRARVEEEEARNKLFSDCLHRGLQMWRDANPDKDYWISGDENIKWLVDTAFALHARVDVAEARVEALEAKNGLLEKLARIVREKLKNIEALEWELGVMESIDAYFEIPA